MNGHETPGECGCTHSQPARRQFLTSTVSRRAALGFGLLGLAAFASFGGPLVLPAYAADYPSWDDVQRAKANEQTKAAEIARIEGLIAGLAADLAAKQAAAQQAGDAFYAAQQEFFAAGLKAQQLQAAADAQATAASDAATKAGRVASQLYRSGGDDTPLELFFSGSAAGTDELLSRLGTMDRLMERNQDVYATAVTARDSARSLTDQAVVARNERDRLQQVAEQKMIEAQRASDAAAAALAEQQAREGELQAQLAALKDTTATTVAAYQEGERIRQEAERKAREEAERIAREQAAAGGGGGHSGGGGGGGGGVVGGGGWARPSSGRVTSNYGPRSSQCNGSYCSTSTHYGVDMSSGYGSGIYAAAAGRVVFAAYNGGFGNFIKIDHGGGISTGYAHIKPGGYYVGYGQNVSAGQLIGAEGETGNTFGSNLHFEFYVNGYPENPSNNMAARGVRL